MGERTIRRCPPLGGRRIAGAAAALALIGFCDGAGAQRSSVTRDSGAGSIVHFEESRGSNVIYLEERGGMLTRVAAPVARERDEATASKAPGAKPSQSRPTNRRAVARAVKP
jgi:hypothetical protein